MKGKICIVVLLLLCLTMLSGCWSKKELTDLAFVIAVGIDKTKEGQYVTTYQVVNPGNVAGAKQIGGGASGVPISIFISTGDNLFEASRKASKKMSRLLYFAHTNLVVIGEGMAREGIGGLLDVLERSNQFRTTAKVIIAHHHSAEEVLKVLTPIDKISANQIIKTLEFSERTWGQTINTDVWKMIHDIASSGKHPVASGVDLIGSVEKGQRLTNVQVSEPDARLNLDDLALFKDDKLVSWVSGEAARGVLWVLDKIKQTGVTIEWNGKKEAVGYKVIRTKTEVVPHLKHGKPSISIDIRAEGDIAEAPVPIDLADVKQVFALEKMIQHNIKKEVLEAVKKAQQEKIDVFGFGDAVYRSYPEEWKKMENKWHEHFFPQLPVTVTVDAFIRRTGLRNKPYQFGR
ncbi:Ger(x)C family spore germination protein [Brevibacillus sp. SYP-B805]|uniref:Ger(x)C family spore germination protein n=1 Tax=Brevibacillus sp. SYP-B805 TaxID=1578199 RepID=UPI0013ECE62C|nr:Ger(x)C family spore germination protein [Brevibacillus sp. SYP-B805]NGQ93675.1 Ger(x)C family spore germination protein [Brevibacillus sp. SYP-B805]